MLNLFFLAVKIPPKNSWSDLEESEWAESSTLMSPFRRRLQFDMLTASDELSMYTQRFLVLSRFEQLILDSTVFCCEPSSKSNI